MLYFAHQYRCLLNKSVSAIFSCKSLKKAKKKTFDPIWIKQITTKAFSVQNVHIFGK